MNPLAGFRKVLPYRGKEKPTFSVAHHLPTDARKTIDPELAAVVQAWDHLPAPIRAAVLALVKASVPQSEGC